MYDHINENNVLPEPSVLEKLKAHNPSAPSMIMAMTEAIARSRQEEERNAASKTLRSTLFNLRARTASYTPQPSAPVMAYVGDDLRLAIHRYMAKHDLTPDTLCLTEQERQSLEPIVEKPGTGRFRNLFPSP